MILKLLKVDLGGLIFCADHLKSKSVQSSPGLRYQHLETHRQNQLYEIISCENIGNHQYRHIDISAKMSYRHVINKQDLFMVYMHRWVQQYHANSINASTLSKKNH